MADIKTNNRGRKAGDGRGRMGGRVAGTPNKEKPLKTFLREHSIDYFTPNIPAEEAHINFPDDASRADFISRYKDKIFSQYEVDLLLMKPSDRVTAELALLNYHTPKMQASSVDMNVREQNLTVTERIKRIVAGQDIISDEE